MSETDYYKCILLLRLSLLCPRITLYFGYQLSNSNHEVEQLSEKLSALEAKMHNVSNHTHGQSHIVLDYDEMTGYLFVAIFVQVILSYFLVLV